MTAATPPTVVLFDVNETLSDLGPLADRFGDVGAPDHLARTWFATLLRDGFALTAAGGRAPFSTLGREVLSQLLGPLGLDRDLDEAVEHVMSGFLELEVHPDVPAGLRRLSAAGLRLATLTNGATAVAERLLGSAGLIEHVEVLLSVEDAPAWKPAPSSYDWAVERLGCARHDVMLVAVHPWDIDGAARVGLRTAWVRRDAGDYPGYMTPPELTVSGIDDLAERLAA